MRAATLLLRAMTDTDYEPCQKVTVVKQLLENKMEMKVEMGRNGEMKLENEMKEMGEGVGVGVGVENCGRARGFCTWLSLAACSEFAFATS